MCRWRVGINLLAGKPNVLRGQWNGPRRPRHAHIGDGINFEKSDRFSPNLKCIDRRHRIRHGRSKFVFVSKPRQGITKKTIDVFELVGLYILSSCRLKSTGGFLQVSTPPFRNFVSLNSRYFCLCPCVYV